MKRFKNQNAIIVLLTLVLLASSCKFDNHQCSYELTIYKQTWNDTIKEVAFCEDYGGQHIITTSGEHILFKPYQNIISWADPGEHLVKLPNKNWTYLIDKENDTMKCRLYSKTCDTIVEK